MSESPEDQIVQTGGVPCAFCDSTDTELIALFGQFLLSSQFYCNNCHSVFEAVRWKAPSSGEADQENKGD
jgi:hypothetical protein